jgi:hypothetical protein
MDVLGRCGSLWDGLWPFFDLKMGVFDKKMGVFDRKWGVFDIKMGVFDGF